MSRREIDLRCLQKIKSRGVSTRMIEGKDSRYKCFWIFNKLGTGGVGVLLAERWIEKIFDIRRVSDRLTIIKVTVGEVAVTALLVYAPQTGLTIGEKELFYNNLQNLVQTIDESDMFLICGNWNSHFGKAALGYKGIHSGYVFGKRNIDGERILEFADASSLVVGN